MKVKIERIRYNDLRINEFGYYSNGYFSYHNFYESHRMDMGNSDARVTEVNSSTITYGYGMSTPTISITITLKGSNYEVKFGISLGQQLVEVVSTHSASLF